MNACLKALLAGGLVVFNLTSEAQTILFDFNDAPAHSGLPIAVAAGGVTAQLTSTGQGFSIQAANTMGFTPAGFSGNCVYPNSVFAADLLIGFSQAVTNFSIMYAPQELGCDDSATMRVTAYSDASLIGSATATAANPGTWPTELLSYKSSQSFNRVVIHYATRPPTCQDWGPIFLADNMSISLAPQPIVLTNTTRLADGSIQIGFSYTPGQNCFVFGTDDPGLAFSRWTPLGAATEVASGYFEFIDAEGAVNPRRFYRVRSP